MTRSEPRRPFYYLILEGRSCLSADEYEPMELEAGDFGLMPAAREFAISGGALAEDRCRQSTHRFAKGEARLGDADQPSDYHAFLGYCVLGSPDDSLLLLLLPRIIRIRRPAPSDVDRGFRRRRRAHGLADVILSHRWKVPFIEAPQSTTATRASPGILRDLTDDRIAAPLRQIHGFREGAGRWRL